MGDSIEAIRTNAVAGARQLLVGGLCDPQWDPNRANELATQEVGIEVRGACSPPAMSPVRLLFTPAADEMGQISAAAPSDDKVTGPR